MQMKNIILLIFIVSGNLFALTEDAFYIKNSARNTIIKPFSTLFGDRVIGERSSLLNIHFYFGIPTDLVSTQKLGSGMVSYDSSNNAAVLGSGVGTGASLATMISTKKVAPLPFSETYLYITAMFDDTDAAGTTQWVGFFDDNDGFAVGCKNGRFSILHRRSGDNDIVIPKDNFNVDKLNGTGRSKFSINKSFINVFRISYGWLGTTPIVFELLTPEGSWHPFHILRKTNFVNKSSLGSSVLPVCAQVKRLSGSSDVAMKVIALGAGMIGKRTGVNHRNYSVIKNDFRLANGQTKPVITIRNKNSFMSKVNLFESQLSMISISSEKHMRFWLTKNAELTGASFADVNENSAVEVDTSATAATGGEPLLTFFNNQRGHENIFLKSNNFNVSLMPGESVSIIAKALANGCDVDATINWNEMY